MLLGFFGACQWNSHIFRLIITKQPHIRIEGDKIIAFGKTFPKGPNDFIIFEPRPYKRALWTTLRNGNQVMHIPLICECYFEYYVQIA
jgi:hypothetical protein